MTTLHIEPETLRESSRLLEAAAVQLLDAETDLRRAAAMLEMAWQGGHSESFINELQTAKTSLQTRTDELYSYTMILLRQADKWDEMDQTWRQQYLEMKF
jgi:uncharacterized protein YukE